MSDDARLVAVVTAIPEERRAIAARMRGPRRDARGVTRGRIGAHDVVLARAGDGQTRAARAAAEVCDAHHPAVLVGVGVAGALSEELVAGEIVVSRIVRDASGPAPPPDEALLARVLSLPGVRPVTLVAAAAPVLTRSERAALEEIAGGGPAAVDMESAAWAREAARRRIPYLILRAISDETHDELPGYLLDCMDEQGGIRRSSVMARALAHPSSIPVLLRMRSRVRDCGDRLAALLEHLLAEGV